MLLKFIVDFFLARKHEEQQRSAAPPKKFLNEALKRNAPRAEVAGRQRGDRKSTTDPPPAPKIIVAKNVEASAVIGPVKGKPIVQGVAEAANTLLLINSEREAEADVQPAAPRLSEPFKTLQDRNQNTQEVFSMAQGKRERLELILRELRENNDEIDGAALLTPEGLLLGHNLSNGHRPEHVAALAAPLLELGKKAAAALENNGFQELHMQGATRSIIIYNASKSVLAVTIKKSANLGMINLDVRSAVEAIDQVW